MIELLTPAQFAEADRLAINSGIPGIELMENAGRSVAEYVAAQHPSTAKVTVIAGPGNNGGDGFIAARVLADWGYRVRMLLLGSIGRLRGDAALAAQRWNEPVESAESARFAPTDIVIDALYGAGLDRPLEGAPAALISAMNLSGAPIYAVDLPSGISGSDGTVRGIAVRARATVTFFRKKPGHLLLPGRLHCGPVQVADIGIPKRVLEQIRPNTFLNGPELWRRAFRVPAVDGHKYTRGHAVVLSGGMASTGAARLAARGALRAGAGLVTIASPREALAINAATNLAVMVRPVDGTDELAAFLSDARRNAVVLGPGLGVGPATRDLVLAALAGSAAVVLDADALTSFAGAPDRLAAAIRARSGAPTVLTPHEGEFGRVFKKPDEEPHSKLRKSKQASENMGAIVLLKGADTVVAGPDGRAAIAENAPPWLATAGSGDVLAGFIGGLLAQGMPAFEAAAAAVWLQGEAANECGPGLIAEDLPEVLPRVYRRLFAELGPLP